MRTLPTDVAALAASQDGVVSRAQLLAAGAAPHDVRAWLRTRLLTLVHPGVYVDHTGPLTRRQSEWAAVSYAAPAALWGASALVAADRAHRVSTSGPIHVAVDERRRVTAPPRGVQVHRVHDLDGRSLLRASPPRMRVEEAVVDVAATARTDLDAVATLARAVSSRCTTVTRLRAVADRRTRLPRRALVAAVLDDLEAGACSVLERAYLRDVERAHGLPTAGRQVRASARGTVYRDVDYPRYGLVVELDGRLDHTDVADRDRDLDRDLDAAVDGRVTVRLGHGQVVGRRCATAVRLGTLLRRRGWAGDVRRCPSCP